MKDAYDPAVDPLPFSKLKMRIHDGMEIEHRYGMCYQGGKDRTTPTIQEFRRLSRRTMRLSRRAMSGVLSRRLMVRSTY